ncbi:MAG: AMP-binding protein [Gemmatimonadetes bacterium]|nr:long-chain fatty acid--CoA ligase [Gemmatimonadota bacterium]NIQ59036.1 long-chain fatty acid--CoA ligase [Gemmatimonadota bacterium]NIU79244.1 AMP-binding protein [Gammaproteobacteria bacterium]NIX47925.1 AMP-binding protein [Gemmatimonadota bacterium]NIY12290.1 AMP-binding protein [Gemmatimonadota bacterium]
MAAFPWLRHYDDGVPHSLRPYPERTLLDSLAEAVAEAPDRPAIRFKGAAVSHARLDRESDAFAAALAELGVRKGDRVALLLPNCPQFVIAQLGAWKAGAIVAPLNPLYTDRELQEALTRTRPLTIVVLNRFYDQVRRIQSTTTIHRIIATGIKDYLPPALRLLYSVARERKDGERIRLRGEDRRFTELLRRHRGAARPAVEILPDDPALLLMSGGTTGTPKAVAGLHRSLVASGMQLRTWLSPVLTPWDDTMLLPLPLFHVYGNAGALSFALVGHNPLILVPNARDMDDLVATVRRTRPSFLVGVPALFNALVEHPDVRSGKVDLGSIRGCFSGASPLLAESKRRFEEETGGVIIEGYSLSEAMMACCANPVRGTNKVGSVGVPLPDVALRIVDPDDPTVELSRGEVGEILLAGPQIMAGYWEDPEETAGALAILPDGSRWLRTGDLGRVDDDDYLFIVDRKKDLIKVSGLQVWPREVEEAIATHPAVAEVGVVGIPHPRKGEVPKAWVVLRSDTAASPEEIREHCRRSLAPFKTPAEVEICAELPRTMVGKVLRRELRTRAAAATPPVASGPVEAPQAR